MAKDKKYKLIGFYNYIQNGEYCKTLIESNDFDELHNLLEKLIFFDIDCEIFDTTNNTVVLTTKDYGPSKN